MEAPDRATAVSRRRRRGNPEDVEAQGVRARIALVSLLVLGLAAGSVLLAGVAADTWLTVDAGAAASLPAALTLVAAGTCALGLAWLSLSVAAAAAAQLAPRREARLLRRVATPDAVRHLVCALLGVAVAGGSISTATAGERLVVAADVSDPAPQADLDPRWTAGTTGTASASPADDGDLDPGWTPATPALAPRETPSPELLTGMPRHDAAPETDEVVVRRGDTLWDLAARTLPPTATDAEIAAEWPRWYAANAATIGADPDLLLPGQRLRVPATDLATVTSGTQGGTR